LTGVFPDSLKKAQVTPLHKKNDPLSKTNYRPVSVLPVFSKIYYLKLHKLTICLAVWHVVGNQKPLKGPSELMLYNNFCLGLHTNLLEV
jgi:hypothetical protein